MEHQCFYASFISCFLFSHFVSVFDGGVTGEKVPEGRKCWCVDVVAVQSDADPSTFTSIYPLTCLYRWVTWDLNQRKMPLHHMFWPYVCPVHLDFKFLEWFKFSMRRPSRNESWMIKLASKLHLPKLDLQVCNNHMLGNNFIHLEMPQLGTTYSCSWDIKQCQNYDQIRTCMSISFG